jgi:hypothetical protein
MAVQFQRRNVGALMDLPTFEDVGVSAYQDFTDGGQVPALMEEPMQEVLPPESESDVAAAENAAAQLIAAAEKQRAAAGNPLNRGLSVLGGIIGAPFNFLGAALGGGDMSAVTAPFRPQQQADMRFQQTRMGIEDKLAEIRKDYASMESSRAGAVRQALGTDRDEKQAGYDTLGQLASSMLYMDPAARAQRAPSLLAIARRYPALTQDVKDLIDSGFDDASLIAYGSLSGDEGARQRTNEYAYGNKTINFGDGVGAILPSRPGVAPQVVGPGMTISAPPAIGGRPTVLNTPAPAVGKDGFPTSLTEEQYRALVGATSRAEVDQLIRDRGITVGTPAAPADGVPSLDEIEAELKRRGVQ